MKTVAGRFAAVLLFTCLALLPGRAVAEGSRPVVVAIVDFEYAGDKLAADAILHLADAVRVAASEELDKDRFRVLDRATMEVFFTPQDRQCAAGSCLLDIGKKMQADFIVGGKVSFVAGSLLITLEAHDVLRGSQVSVKQAEADDYKGLLAEVRKLAPVVMGQIAGGSGSGGGAVKETTVNHSQAPTQVVAARASRELNPTVDITAKDAEGNLIEGAEIYIDERLEGTTPRSVPMSPGTHSIRVMKDLYHPKTAPLSIAAGDVKSLEFALKPNFGLLTVDVRPGGATVSLDGMSLGQTPIIKKPVKSGDHEVRIELADYLPLIQRRRVESGQPWEIRDTMKQDWGSLSVASDPTGASVFIDGERVGSTPKTIPKVPGGKHRVEIRADPDAYEPWSKDVIIVRGEAADPIHQTLVRRESEVLVTTNPPGASLTIDGDSKGKTTWKGRLLGGKHRFELAYPGYLPVAREERVAPPEPFELRLKMGKGGTGPHGTYTFEDLGLKMRTLPSKPDLLPETHEAKSPTWLFWTGLLLDAGGVGSLVGGGVIGGPFMQDKADGTGTEFTGSGVLLAIGVAGIVTGIVLNCIGWDTEEAPDNDAISVNRDRMNAWQANASVIESQNRRVEQEVKSANDALQKGN